MRFFPYNNVTRNVYVLFFSRIIISLGSFVIPFLSVFLTTSMDLSSEIVGLIVTLVNLAYIPGTIIGGKLTDKYNMKNVLILSQILSALCFILVPICNNTLKLIFIFVSFMISGALLPCMDSIISRTVKMENRKESFSLIYLGYNIGYAIGPLLGSILIVKNIDFLFIGDGLTTIVSAILILIFIKLPKQEEYKKGFETNSINTTDSALNIIKNYKYLFIFATICAFYNFIYAQSNFTLPLYLNDQFNLTVGTKYYGILMTTNALTIILLTPMITKTPIKVSTLTNTTISGLLYAIGFGMYFITHNLFFLIIATIVWSLGEIFFSISFSLYLSENSPPTHIGRISSLANVFARTGKYVSPLLSGLIIKYIGLSYIWILIFLIMLIAASLIWQLNLKSQSRGNNNSIYY